MTTEQRNLIITFVAIALVLGGVYYFQKSKQKTYLLPTEENSVEITTPTPPPQGGEDSSPISEGGVPEGGGGAELKAQEAAKKAKWGIAMDNARAAFRAGDFNKAISFYNEALSYIKDDSVYAGLFVVYSVQNNIDQARIAIDAAIKLSPSFTQHWKDKLGLLDEKTNVSYADLKKIYNDGLLKVDPKTKVNLVTFFAGIAENNGQKDDAIAAWEYAKQLFPENSVIYQVEIDRLQASP